MLVLATMRGMAPMLSRCTMMAMECQSTSSCMGSHFRCAQRTDEHESADMQSDVQHAPVPDQR